MGVTPEARYVIMQRSSWLCFCFLKNVKSVEWYKRLGFVILSSEGIHKSFTGISCIIQVYRKYGYSISIHQHLQNTAQKLQLKHFKTLNKLSLQVFYGFFLPMQKGPKMRNSVSRWGPDSMNYITTFSVLAAD